MRLVPPRLVRRACLRSVRSTRPVDSERPGLADKRYSHPFAPTGFTAPVAVRGILACLRSGDQGRRRVTEERAGTQFKASSRAIDESIRRRA